MNDTMGKSLTYGKVLIGAILFSRLVRRRLPQDRQVGVVLPPSVGGTVVNLGLVLAGKVPVNLNFTASADAFVSSMEQADIRTVITAGKMMEKAPGLPWPEQVMLAEDVIKEFSSADRIFALLLAHRVANPCAAGAFEQRERMAHVEQPDRLEIRAEERARGAQRVVAVGPLRVLRGQLLQRVLGEGTVCAVTPQQMERRCVHGALGREQMRVHCPPLVMLAVGVHGVTHGTAVRRG
jgi:hypothetical protein